MGLTYCSKLGTLPLSRAISDKSVGLSILHYLLWKNGNALWDCWEISWVITCELPGTVPGLLTSAWQVEDEYSQLLLLLHQHCNKFAVRFRSFVILCWCQLMWAADHVLSFFFLSKKYMKKWLSQKHMHDSFGMTNVIVRNGILGSWLPAQFSFLLPPEGNI